MNCSDTLWNGLPAVCLTGGGYEAIIIPEMGANCISLTRPADGLSFLRVPADVETLRNGANVYGLPLLFPANRIRDGHYDFDGRSYDFPINEPARNHHIHGVLSSTPFIHEGNGVFSYEATADDPYLAFPHAFRFCRIYQLDEDGLHMTLTCENRSDTRMPFGTGIHAAWNDTFRPGDREEDSRLLINAKCEWPYDDRIIPTCQTVADSADLAAYRKEGHPVAGEPISILMEANEHPLFRLKTASGSFCCAPQEMRFVMVWNGTGNQHFICPEPQNWLNDAPNLHISPEQSGFTWIEPGETGTYHVRWWWQAD